MFRRILLSSLVETINDLTRDVSTKRKSLDDALFALQSWVEQNAPMMTETDRSGFSEVINAEKETSKRDGEPYGDDATLIASVLRLHAMRLLYRHDQHREGIAIADPEDESAYGRAKRRLQTALHEVEVAVNEARIDTAIANAHHILMDRSANRRWLQDALIRLQTVSQKDLVRLAEAVPMPELPPPTLVQRVILGLFRVKREELARRSINSMRQIAELQTSQMLEMLKLLAESFNAIDDQLGVQQTLALMVRLGADKEA
jgi:hypothetical protein